GRVRPGPLVAGPCGPGRHLAATDGHVAIIPGYTPAQSRHCHLFNRGLDTMHTRNRRTFLKQGLIGTAGVTIGTLGMSARSYASIQGANDRVNIAVIGIRNQGTVHLRNLCGLKDSHNVQVRTVCDADERLFDKAVALVQKETGVAPATQWDMQQVFADPAIDAVTIAVPNHWHALATIWATQAGKHVYVEKPASHNIW